MKTLRQRETDLEYKMQQKGRERYWRTGVPARHGCV
jgi:hypothetical protein